MKVVNTGACPSIAKCRTVEGAGAAESACGVHKAIGQATVSLNRKLLMQYSGDKSTHSASMLLSDMAAETSV
jgi:hypothetical protein